MKNFRLHSKKKETEEFEAITLNDTKGMSHMYIKENYKNYQCTQILSRNLSKFIPQWGN